MKSRVSLSRHIHGAQNILGPLPEHFTAPLAENITTPQQIRLFQHRKLTATPLSTIFRNAINELSVRLCRCFGKAIILQILRPVM